VAHDNTISFLIGNDEGILDIDVKKHTALLHTHHATANSAPATFMSSADLASNITFGMAQNWPMAAAVIGSICGGPMATSMMAIDRNVIYVTNPYEEHVVKGSLSAFRLPFETEQLILNREYDNLYVIVDSDKVQQIASQFHFSENQEKAMLRAGQSLTPLSDIGAPN